MQNHISAFKQANSGLLDTLNLRLAKWRKFQRYISAQSRATSHINIFKQANSGLRDTPSLSLEKWRKFQRYISERLIFLSTIPTVEQVIRELRALFDEQVEDGRFVWNA
ncbi:hypothetical protein B0T24DRAFT_598308 [Lasiosphaeria ovina]|uniref:Uncharacterized protein n=1 Tax=Lasiosphaeria ovina TaxID=92902 RepID=A0AAE0JVA8_9PEZI|nr:hypothetical protein B0T24DRAFT_598308 [Lasiosphaeria ovina]